MMSISSTNNAYYIPASVQGIENTFKIKNGIEKLAVQQNQFLQTKIDNYIKSHSDIESMASAKTFTRHSVKENKALYFKDLKASLKGMEQKLEGIKTPGTANEFKAALKDAKRQIRKAKAHIFFSKLFNTNTAKLERSIKSAYAAKTRVKLAANPQKLNSLKTIAEGISKSISQKQTNREINELDIYKPIEIKDLNLPKGIKAEIERYNAALEQERAAYNEALSHIEKQIETARSDESNRLGEGGFGLVYQSGNFVVKTAKEAVSNFEVEAKNNKDLKDGIEAAKASGKELKGVENLTSFVGTARINGEVVHVFEKIKGKEAQQVLGLTIGHDLAQFPEKIPSFGEKIGIVDGFLGGIEAMHSAGMVHLDIKPANIMLTENNFAKCIDFGIARVAGSSRAQGSNGGFAVLGTYPYMAPEMLYSANPTRMGGEAYEGTYSTKMDVFSVGVTLIETLFPNTRFSSTVLSSFYLEGLYVHSGNKYLPRFSRENYNSWVGVNFYERAITIEPNVANKLPENYGEQSALNVLKQEDYTPIQNLLFRCLHPEPTERPTVSELRTQLMPLLQNWASRIEEAPA